MNENGQLILETLKSYKVPVTSLNIAKKLANAIGADVDEIKDDVYQTLEGGVQFGYVQRVYNKYYSKSVGFNKVNDEFVTDDDVEVVSPTKKLQDRPRRRSRKRSRSRSRRSSGRSRSRSRRRR